MNQQEHIPVFYEGQDDLVDILATSIASICYNTESFIDFYILDCGMCDFNKKLLVSMKKKFNNFSIEFIPIDLKQFEGLKGYTEKNFIDCYSRILIPELKKDLDKAIYLDSDTIALDDISELWNEDLNGKSIGVILDLGLFKGALKNFTKVLKGSPSHPYFSGGVYVMDCKKWRDNNISQVLLSMAKQYKHQLFIIIEELLSLYFKEDYQLLSSRYGFIDANGLQEDKMLLCKLNTSSLRDMRKNICFMHFAGASKPWQSYKTQVLQRATFYVDNFWYFASLTPFYYGLKAKLYENLLKKFVK